MDAPLLRLVFACPLFGYGPLTGGVLLRLLGKWVGGSEFGGEEAVEMNILTFGLGFYFMKGFGK